MDRNENNQDFFPKPLDSNFSSNNLKSWTFAVSRILFLFVSNIDSKIGIC